MSDVNDIYAGPGIFVWGINSNGTEEAGAITIDLTQGGIRFFTETTYFEPTTDQTGTAPVKSIKTGTVGRVELATPDMKFDKVVSFNPDASKVVDGTTSSKIKYQITGLAGRELPRKRAVIKPQGITDPNRYIYLEACSIKFDVDARFQLDANQTMTINGLAYPSLEATPKGLLYTWGDITATA
ncbi:hypothetical protein [Paenibacillus koleovorans]|uniref:hypothetical protein n=1 Tax=Paenibacillus koleovorans TaxID=121608 RepID=UPI000FDC4C33|nr:hypothetical protein [Paenibacillus koleovorans]